MSKHAISRLPSHISHVLKIYEHASNKVSLYKNSTIKNYLYKTSDEYNNFQKLKLIRYNQFNENDFPPIISQTINPLFESSLELGRIEEMRTEELFKHNIPRNEDYLDPIYSNYNKTTKNFTDTHAKLITSFASYYKPYVYVPEVSSIVNSFKWYIKLLNNTPIFFILKQKNRLFSHSSLLQINKPLIDLNRHVTRLGNSFMTDINDEKAIRNYHLTDLLTIDIFNLAVKAQNYFNNEPKENFNKNLSEIRWKETNQKEDKLTEAVVDTKAIEITDGSLNHLDSLDPADLIEKFPLSVVLKDLENLEINEIFPYDLKFNSYYLLTIENPIVNEDHTELLNLLENSEFEFLGVRLSLDNPFINDFFNKALTKNGPTTNFNYDQLLEIPKNHHKNNNENINKLMKRLGELGLVTVEEGCNKNCTYLLPQDK